MAPPTWHFGGDKISPLIHFHLVSHPTVTLLCTGWGNGKEKQKQKQTTPARAVCKWCCSVKWPSHREKKNNVHCTCTTCIMNRTLLACNAFRRVFMWNPPNPTAPLPFAFIYLFLEGNFSRHLLIYHVWLWLWLLQVLSDYYSSCVGFDFSGFLSMRLKAFRAGFCLTRQFNTDVLLYLLWWLFLVLIYLTVAWELLCK